MKKPVLVISLGLLTLGSFAQKKELKLVEKALGSKDYAGALTTLSSIEGVIGNADAKYQSKYSFLKGKALAKTKKYSEAIKELDDVIALEKKSGKKVYTGEVATLKSGMIQDVSNSALDLYNNKKDYKAAAEKFYLTYKLSPVDTSFVFNAAISATQAKDYDAALEYYKELRSVGYTGIETQYIAINKLESKEEVFPSKSQRDLMVKAGKFYNPTVKVTESKTGSIVKNIALILKEQGKTEEAIAAMQEARKESPKDLSLILSEAELYVELEKMDEFGKLMKEAIAIDPENPTLYFNLGVVNINQGRVDEAKGYYKKAIELKPDYYDAYMNLAAAILADENAIIEEQNKNLSNHKKYDELELKRKVLYNEALPYVEKGDSIKRSIESVRTLMNIHDFLENTAKGDEYRALYNSLK